MNIQSFIQSKFKSKSKLSVWAGLVICLCIFSIKVIPVSNLHEFAQKVEYTFYDIRLKDLYRPIKNPNVVIMDVDEKAVTQEGKWPWSMDRLVQILDGLREQEAALAAFHLNLFDSHYDLVNSIAGVIEKYTHRSVDPQSIFEFIEDMTGIPDKHRFMRLQMQRMPVVLSAWATLNADDRLGALPQPAFANVKGFDHLPRIIGYKGNLPTFQQQAAGGILYITEQIDKTPRTIPLLLQRDNNLYANLCLQIFQQYQWQQSDKHIKPISMIVSHGRSDQAIKKIQRLKVGAYEIATDQYSEILVPYRGGANAIPRYSAADLLNRTIPKDTLKGKIVIVTSSAGLDLRAFPTPLGGRIQDVDIQAQITQSFLDGYLPQWFKYDVILQGSMILALGIVCALFFAQLNFLQSISVALGMCFILVTAVHVIWSLFTIYIPVAWLIIMIMAMLIAQQLLNYQLGKAKISAL